MSTPDDQAEGGVLMVGSVRLPDAKTVFTKLTTSLPSRLRSIPDGETGERHYFVHWQAQCFPPETTLEHWNPGNTDPLKDKYTVESLKPTRFDDFAIASYAEFVKLREQGIIPPGVRFQVCIAPPLDTLVIIVKTKLIPQFEPLYEERLQQTIKRIVDNIPHDDLLIQWDLPVDVLALEYERGALTNPVFKMWFEPVLEGILERITRMNSLIPSSVHIAFHLCYGDYDHRHFHEPHDTGVMVEFTHNLVKALGDTHHVDYVHMPVPKDRTDVEYMKPLENLRLPVHTRLCLGLVHAHDEAGTRKRIANAKSVYPLPFAVATECGLGRTPPEDLDNILEISKNVTSPLE